MSHQIPVDGYWSVAGSVFQYQLVSVFAASKAEADRIADEKPRDSQDWLVLAADSLDAQHRLRAWGNLGLANAIMRGDS